MPHVERRAAAPEALVIMLTGWGQRLLATGDFHAQVDVVLSKPPNMAELRQRLAEGRGQ